MQKTKKRSTFTLEMLLSGDRTTFQPRPQEKHTPAVLTVAELKEIAIALNVHNERLALLYQDLQQAEARIEALEQSLRRLTQEE